MYIAVLANYCYSLPFLLYTSMYIYTQLYIYTITILYYTTYTHNLSIHIYIHIERSPSRPSHHYNPPPEPSGHIPRPLRGPVGQQRSGCQFTHQFTHLGIEWEYGWNT